MHTQTPMLAHLCSLYLFSQHPTLFFCITDTIMETKNHKITGDYMMCLSVRARIRLFRAPSNQVLVDFPRDIPKLSKQPIPTFNSLNKFLFLQQTFSWRNLQ